MRLKHLPTSFLFIPPSSSLNHATHQHWNGFTYRSSSSSVVPTREYKHRTPLLAYKTKSAHIMATLISSPSSLPLPESPILCSVDQCETPFDVHCFHCRSNLCSHHYFEHKQQQQQQDSTTENDDAMDDLLQLASSKCFCISKHSSSISKQRRTFSNPFVSSSYLLKKMREQAARRPSTLKPMITTKTTAIQFYNLRKRPGARQRKLVATKTTTVTTTTVKLCRTVLKTRLRNNKLCNRKLPCPYHPIESS